jgi:hypothetical protein
MNISAARLGFDESMMRVDLSDGRKPGVPLLIRRVAASASGWGARAGLRTFPTTAG